MKISKAYDKLNASDVVYEFAYHKELKDRGGDITTDGEIIMINYTHKSKSVEQGTLSTMFHEFEHARQFNDSELAFVQNQQGKWTADPESYDITDEVKAMKFGSLAPGGDKILAKKWDNTAKAAKKLASLGPESYKIAYNNWVKRGSPPNGVPITDTNGLKVVPDKYVTIKTRNAFYRIPVFE